MSTIKLYRHALSGHSHRVQLFLSILGLSADIIDVDLAKGAQKNAEFLQKNRFGQVPVLEDSETTLSDSNAILIYLASKYDATRQWLPEDALAAAEVQRFLSFAAGKVAYGPAAARLVNVFGAGLDHEAAIGDSHAFLSNIDAHLKGRDWLATDNPTIADVANYAYSPLYRRDRFSNFYIFIKNYLNLLLLSFKRSLGSQGGRFKLVVVSIWTVYYLIYIFFYKISIGSTLG